MDHEQVIYLSELIILQALLGSPVYLTAVIAQVVYLRMLKGLGFWWLACSAILLLVLGLAGALLVWRFWRGPDIMYSQFLNLPALIACVVLGPVLIWIIGRVAKPRP